MTDSIARIEAPDFAAIERAAARIAPFARTTPVLRSTLIDELCGAHVFFKCENLQRGGAFKFRGACNAIWALADDVAARGVVTHSSGNHGAALALAARTRGVAAHVIVPEGAVAAKLAAMTSYGAIVHRCAATLEAREQAAAELCARTGATLIHPYVNADVIAGQGTAARELLADVADMDALIAPIGGGGLVGGSAIAACEHSEDMAVYAAEPAGAADALASLEHGERVTSIVPETICDGLRATIGAVNFSILQNHGVTVLTADDAETIAAMRLIWTRMKLIVEPSAAVALAALLRHRECFAGRRVGVVLSGGNVDLDTLPW